jgi:lysyl-tRNA synthetase class 2
VRDFLAARGFLEIEAPIAVPSPGLEVHLDAFVVANAGDAQHYLITSPEYQLKRLIAGGVERLYALGKVFRRGERGRHHNPEFTMLEWYATGWDWSTLAGSVEELIAGAAEALLGSPSLPVAASSAGVMSATTPGAATPATPATIIDLRPPWPRRSIRELFAEVGVTLDGDESCELLRARLAAAGHPLPGAGASWDELFFTVFLDAIEPRLATSHRPTIVYDWPRPLCALARVSPADPRVVERFEAYVPDPSGGGVIELCNGFGELTDPHEQRARLEDDLRRRRERGLPAYPIDERFLSALADLPPCAGVALGLDRLLMLLAGAQDIAQVLPFALEEL